MIRGCVAAVLMFLGAMHIAYAASVLMISIDGMKPGYILEAMRMA